ncbi:class F sortase [Paenibacillus guangzhouensis]|uniref:class F sortase n=1 Tax=Paenibacillus guangzhouensis TaxID=1473112 RepID=UPI001D12D2D3|nr:class F sortase [Paenibacillus guangzhouensis]
MMTPKQRNSFIIAIVMTLLFVGCSTRPSAEVKPQVLPKNQPTQEMAPLQPKTESLPPSAASSIAVKSEKAVRTGIIPNKILIPSVRIQTSVEPVGVLDNGQMEVPESTERVGILMNGVKAGEQGNAVIAGHVDNYTGPAIFYGLKKLKKDDPIILSDASGKYLVYKVLSVESFKTAEAPIDRVFGKTDESRLNLITCTGKYDRKKKEHEKRLIVFARLMK